MDQETKKLFETCLSRAHKYERAGANSMKGDITEKMESLRLIDLGFKWIYEDAKVAYIKLIGAAVSYPSTAKQLYVNRISLYSRMAGYAMMLMMSDEALFTRMMDIAEKPADAETSAELST